MRDVHDKIETLEGTVEAAQSVLDKADRVLTIADEAQQRSRHVMARILLVLSAAAVVVVGLAVFRRRSP